MDCECWPYVAFTCLGFISGAGIAFWIAYAVASAHFNRGEWP